MNPAIKLARIEKKQALLSADIKVYRDRIAWWVGDKAENQKGIYNAKKQWRKLEDAKTDILKTL